MEHILKWFTKDGDGRAPIYVQWFATTFKPSNFTGIDTLYACFIIYCAKLSIVPCLKYLESYLRVDGMGDVKKYKIRLEDMDSYDYDQLSQLMEAYDVIKEVALATFDLYMQEDISDTEFKVVMHEFMSTIKSEKITSAIMKALPKLSDGTNTDDVSEGLRYDLLSIDDTYNMDKISEVDNSDEEDTKMELIATTGIDAIDSDYGGIFTHILYTLNSQPGGGKTRFAYAHFVYRVLTIAKKDVICYATELTKTQAKNILISYHITKLYGVKVPDKLINQNKLSEHQRHLVESAKMDLFESGKYGNIEFKDDCIVEKLEEELKFAVKTNPDLRLIMIDYMGLIESKPMDTRFRQRLEAYEIITEAYKIVRRILKRSEVAALCINQFNDKGIEAAYAGKTIKAGYIQGGHIVHRHTDYDVCITYTEEQNIGGEDKIKFRNLICTKTRGSNGFGMTLLSADLGVSYFKQEVRQ